MIVLKGGTLIDGTGAAPVRDATLVIEDGRIESRDGSGASGPWAPRRRGHRRRRPAPSSRA